MNEYTSLTVPIRYCFLVSMASWEWPTFMKLTVASVPAFSCRISSPPGCWGRKIRTKLKMRGAATAVYLSLEAGDVIDIPFDGYPQRLLCVVLEHFFQRVLV